MRSVNRVTLVGNLGRDAETKFTQSGIARTTFSMATARRVKEGDGWRDETDWHNVVLWRSENLAQHLTKGKQVYVEGRLQTRSYENKDGAKMYTTEVVAEDVILLSGDKQEREDRGEPRQRQKQPVVPFGQHYSRQPVVPFGQHDSRLGDGTDPHSDLGRTEINDDDVPF